MFNIAATGMLVQGRKSVDGIGQCQYRGPDNTKCGVGFIIKDEAYSPAIEGIGIVENSSHQNTFGQQAMVEALVLSGVDINAHNVRPLLVGIQSLHDGFSAVSEWPDELIQVAIAYHLDPLVITEFQLSHPRDRHAAGMVMEAILPSPAIVLATEEPALR